MQWSALQEELSRFPSAGVGGSCDMLHTRPCYAKIWVQLYEKKLTN